MGLLPISCLRKVEEYKTVFQEQFEGYWSYKIDVTVQFSLTCDVEF